MNRLREQRGRLLPFEVAHEDHVQIVDGPIEVGFQRKDHMNISVSRQELDDTAALLELLREWELLTRISDYYSRGEVVFKIDGNHGKVTHGRSVDGYGIVNHPSETCVKKCHRDLDALVSGMAKEAAIKAVEIIKSHMPIPVE